jgi:FtsH-binding integral membrane protein
MQIVRLPYDLPDGPMSLAPCNTVIMASLRIWAGLMGLLILAIASGYRPHLPLRTEAGLAIVVARALSIAVLFMQRRSAAGIIWIVAAVAGLVGASLATFARLIR